MISRRINPVLTSYQKARLQVVGYRAIQSSVNEVLSGHRLNTTQWIILGWLHDNPDGMRVTALAEVLEVETPLVTALVGPLQKKELITTAPDPLDKRAKQLTLSETGEALVVEIEQELSDHLKVFETGFKRHELDAYFSALGRFIDNSKRKAK